MKTLTKEEKLEQRKRRREKREAKRAAQGLAPKQRKQGSLKSEMEHRIRVQAKMLENQRSHSFRDGAIRACEQFDEWRKQAGWTNQQVRDQPREAIQAWVRSLQNPMDESMPLKKRTKKEAYAVSSIHTMVAGVCCGLGIPMDRIAPSGTALDKTKSTGQNQRAERERSREENQNIVRFAELVGGRKTAYGKLCGSDWIEQSDGRCFVRFLQDKGGKNQLQLIAPEHVDEVKAYFAEKAADELIFPDGINKNLDLHGIRAEHARAEYERFAEICRTPEGRNQMRQQLWERFYDPQYGNKAWLKAMESAKKAMINGNIRKAEECYQKARKKEKEFEAEMKDGTYWLHSSNRQAAILNDRPVSYDRLALCCVSVFSLSHWRNEVTVKHYMI